ncbi:MAG: stage III sporulation protein D [Firmicutes bacterium]|nr:stage III sporulation protein D [Bacillota bacterium]
MDQSIVKRVKEVADYIINTKSTIRETANCYGISKSTVHKDVKERLLEIDINKYQEIQKIFKNHIEIRHIRGGESTKKKYSKQN